MKNQTVAYIRVSSLDQNPDSQLQGIEVDKKFIEKASAKDIDRPVLKEMLNYIREGDKVFVHRIDRLARNVKDLLHLVSLINESGASLTFITENLVFDGNESPMSKLMLTLSGTFSEFERRIARERQQEGIENAKAKGVYKGRKAILSEAEAEKLKHMIYDLGMSKGKVAREFGISSVTVYSYLRGRSKPYNSRRK